MKLRVAGQIPGLQTRRIMGNLDLKLEIYTKQSGLDNGRVAAL
jgi:hypothetical protein